MANKQQLRLVDLQPIMSQFSTVALIISKSVPNFFPDKLSGDQRGVINLTLRDSKHHLTNCTCWGQKACVDEYNAMLHIGDVVDVVGAKVMTLAHLSQGLAGQRYQPQATIGCALVVNEGQGYVVRHNSDDEQTIQTLRRLIHQPHKPLGSVLKLADLRCGAGGQERQMRAYVDLLVVVASMRPVRELKRKAVARDGNTHMQCLELVVIDASCSDGVIFCIWHPEWIRSAQYWQERKTILNLIDVRISYSEFYGCLTLTHATCTLIYENPQAAGEDCRELLSFAAMAPLKNFDLFAQTELGNLPAAAQIQTQMTVKQIYARAEGELKDAATEQFTAVLYAMVTKFDIDGQTLSVSKKCKACQRLIPNNRAECDNESCQLEFSLEHSGVRYAHFFNINIQFSDQTGTLIESRLTGGVAEHLLGLTADDFQRLMQREKTDLKWRYLLKHFEVKLLIKKPAVMRKNLAIIVVDMQDAELSELIEKFAVF